MQDHKPKILIYRIPKRNLSLEVRFEENTVWLTVQQVAELLDKSLCEILRYIAGGLLTDSFKANIELGGEDFNTIPTTKDKPVLEYLSLNVIMLIAVHFDSHPFLNFMNWAYRMISKYKMAYPNIPKARFRSEEGLILAEGKAFHKIMNFHIKTPPEGPSLN